MPSAPGGVPEILNRAEWRLFETPPLIRRAAWLPPVRRFAVVLTPVAEMLLSAAGDGHEDVCKQAPALKASKAPSSPLRTLCLSAGWISQSVALH